MGELEWTVCARCLLRVPVTIGHNCELICQLKHSINRDLSATQADIDMRFRLFRESMKEIDMENIINMNYRALTLLGMTTSLLMECREISPKENHYKFDWFLNCLNAVIYENKPIPPFPN